MTTQPAHTFRNKQWDSQALGPLTTTASARALGLPGQCAGNSVIQLPQDPAPRPPVAHLILLFLPVLQAGLLPANKEQHSRVGWLCALPSSPSPAPSEGSQQHCAHPKRALQAPELPGQPRAAPQDSEGRVTGKGYKLEFSLHPCPGEWKLQRMLRLSGQSPDTAGTLLHRHRPGPMLLLEMFAGRRGHRHIHSHLHPQL